MRTRFIATLPFLAALLLPGCVGRYLSNPLGDTRHPSLILAGPTAGINRNFHTGGFRTIEEPSCPIFESGTGWGPSGGMSAEFYTDHSASWSIIPRFMFESRPGQFRQELPDVAVLAQGQAEPVNQSVTVSSNVMYQLVTAELFYKREIFDIGSLRLGVAGGPSASYVIGGANRQVQDLIDPPNARFSNPSGLPAENSGRRLILYDNDIPGRHDFRFSLKAGMQVEVPLFHNKWIMTPGIYYDYGITDVTSLENWQLNSLLFVVDLRYGL
jgi:hypothetical protein